jgi:hypothetical protein
LIASLSLLFEFLQSLKENFFPFLVEYFAESDKLCSIVPFAVLRKNM